jgi:hypothetical protein
MSSRVHVSNEDVNTAPVAAEHNPGEALYVATTLSVWTTNAPDRFAHDVQVNDTAFRRLAPEYYAWLRSRMHSAKLAVLAEQLSQEAFDSSRERFNRIHEWAMARFGEPVLQDAICTLDARDYLPPTVEDRPAKPRTADKDAGSAVGHSMVDAICELAIALGWSRGQLYGSPSLTATQSRGLAGCLRAGERIGQVTSESIEIILPSGARQHFYNLDVQQPWIKSAVRGPT